MTLDEFRKSLTATEPPARLTHALAGLWWDGKGRLGTRATDRVKSKIGRNDPCPCGSGKKYKRCCGAIN
jgi:uncharacterized protein YecA (UPF0149 family)